MGMSGGWGGDEWRGAGNGHEWMNVQYGNMCVPDTGTGHMGTGHMG